MNDIVPRPSEGQQPRWKPLSSLDRRVVGVLVEKAKTTPDGYPMSVNALRSGCNQKNNRFPLMEVEPEDIEESLARLRAAGAVSEVQGGGRVPRYRHYMYEWLGVDKVELAVMTELLLRGAQSEGDLRGRAARMEPIADVAALRPVLASLAAKGLIISLTPEGRGHMLSHALYEERELEKLRAEFASGAHAERSDSRESTAPTPVSARSPSNPPSQPPSAATSHARSPSPQAAPSDDFASRQTVEELRQELTEVRAELAAMRKDLDDLWSNFR